METECVERVAAAEAETARLRASLADVVAQSEACVNDAVHRHTPHGEVSFFLFSISILITGD